MFSNLFLHERMYNNILFRILGHVVHKKSRNFRRATLEKFATPALTYNNNYYYYLNSLCSAQWRFVTGNRDKPSVKYCLIGLGVSCQHEKFFCGQWMPNSKCARHVNFFMIIMTPVRHSFGWYEFKHVDDSASGQ